MNTPQEPDRHNAAEWLAQATAEYRHLASSLSALGSELAALREAIQSPGSHDHEIAVRQAWELVNLHAVADGPKPETEPLLRVNLLGPFQLYFGGRKLTADMPGQVQTILKYLISQRKHPISKDALLDLLWPDADPTVASRHLRVVMHTFRKNVQAGPPGVRELVTMSGNSYMLNPDISLWVDVEQFEQCWHRGWRLARSGHIAEAVYEYEQAESLYIGDYLEDEPYADWTLLRREALRDAYGTMLTMLAQMLLEMDDFTGAIIWAQKLLAQDDCREDAYRHLIAGHTRLGQPGRAAYWYSQCARTLKSELGLDPSPETQALYASIY